MRFCAVILAAILAVSACAPGAGFLAPDDTPQSVYGSFLAARYANTTRDVEESSRLYAEALGFEPESGFISQRAFLAALLAGDFVRADIAARAAVSDSDTARLAGLYLDASRLAGARLEPVAVSDERTDRFADLISQVIGQWAMVDRRQVAQAQDAAAAIASPFAASSELLVHRALILERAGRYDQAEDIYRAANTVLDSPDFTTMLLGEFLERQGRGEAAAALYRQRLTAGAPFADAEVRAALDRVEAGRRAPRFPEPGEAAARALYPVAMQLAEQASVDYTALFLRLIQRLDPGFQRNTFSLAETLEYLELTDTALSAYRALDSGPFETRAGVQAAWLVYRSGEPEAGLELARGLVEADGSETPRLVLADMLRASERCAEAAPIYEQVFAARAAAGRPADWRPYYYAGVCRQISDGWEAAEPLLLQALEIAPDEPRVLNHLGYYWIVLETRIEDGFTLVARAAELAPENGSILDSLGWGHFKQGRLNEAVRWLEDAVARSPGNPTINWHLGDVYAASGRDLEAEFQWRRALELDPDTPERALIERRLELGLQAGPADLE